ncbi:F-box domain-containing protein [Heracleum sosnowskyi]|uniref:F-box domain-containing protein n=1 Tax=Heracleum sosnowskyi TaxID=360622 RepID=A0AAD8MS44_9APIA|nr:F-box domain-containing protein [Heracleum sosnowskyi]
MTGDVPKRQYYARRAKTANPYYRVCDIDVGPKRRRLASRRRLVGGDSELLHRDRMSNLPQDLIHCIVKWLSVHDAARTSVLSKEWRYIWGMNTRLVLDELFFSQLTLNKDKEEHEAAFLRAVEMIILVPIGPILSFSLYIPPKLNQCPVPRWIDHFLKKGVRDIKLINSEKNVYEIPSCLFDSVELTHLNLYTWIFNLPNKFTSAANLVWVKLINITFKADISFGKQLKFLSLEHCSGIEHLGCQFTNDNRLAKLRITASEQIDWRWLECTKQLKFFGLELTPVANFNREKSVNLIRLLGNVPSLSGLYTSGFTLEVLGPDVTVMKGLATHEVKNLRALMLSQLGSCNLRQISASLELIRCLPNLRRLDIIMEVAGVKNVNPIELTRNLDSVDWKDISLAQLHTVKIQDVMVSNYLFQFIKFLLASSPLLRVMLLICTSEAIDPIEKSKIKQELQHFPKISLAAQIILR